ncbi:hypothetical protein [Streptomyces sp. V3I7]|uniref:hypothetical protein n=1 Tax=Streptomyces sp. V3I7 TaxID=3042278 RepID=UPI002785CF1A|nr:hypothetical protein [Streptomyces sp. V3I7]MDQ0991451.1 hypothetical protein [Streptomyces sp. V3I7]
MSFTTTRSPLRLAAAAAGTTAVLALTLAACGGSEDSAGSSMPGMDHGSHASHSSRSSRSPSSSHATGESGGESGMPGMDHGSMPGAAHGDAAVRDGLADAADGYRLTSGTRKLPASEAGRYAFRITGPDGKPVTAFAPDQAKRMHFYAIRSDLTGFQHVHPVMAADGTWTADLAALTPGSWRMFASFAPDSGAGKGRDYVLSRTVTVPGDAHKAPLPTPATRTEVDGYTVTVKGEPMAGMAHPLTVSITRQGKPVTDLQPYLDTYAHLTAFHEGDQAFAHLHPETAVRGTRGGGPDLSFHAELPEPGKWRLFLQFRTDGKLHTAAVTLRVNG